MAMLSGISSAQIIQLPDPNGQQPKQDADAPEPTLKAEQIRPAFDAYVADLASGNFAARQSASTHLSANEQFTLEMLETALKRPDLTLEARYRLFGIARQRFFRSPRAALGFKFGGQLRDRVVVGETYENFASFKLLEIGDMIVGADGVKIEGPSGQAMLQSIILSHDPGESIRLTVRRGARKMELEVPLGPFAGLPNVGGGMLEDRLARAWRIRAQSRMGGLPEPVRVEGPKAPWTPPLDEMQRRLDVGMRRDANENPIRIVGGGMPRAAQMGDDNRFLEQGFRPQMMVMPNGKVQVINMPVFRNAVGGGFGNFDDDGRAPLSRQRELADLLEAKMEMTKRLGGIDPALLPPTDSRKPALLELKKQYELIQKQFDAVDAEEKEFQVSAPKDKHSAADANPAPLP
jgi:hypothetical protein